MGARWSTAPIEAPQDLLDADALDDPALAALEPVTIHGLMRRAILLREG